MGGDPFSLLILSLYCRTVTTLHGSLNCTNGEVVKAEDKNELKLQEGRINCNDS